MEISIRQALLDIADSVPEIQSKYYGSEFEANLNLDDAVFPMMHVQRIYSSGVDQNKAGVYRKYWNVFVFFAVKTEMDASADENEDIRSAMEDLAVKYLAAVNKSKLFQSVPTAGFISPHYKFDVNAVGVLKSFRLKEKEGHAYC